MVFGEKSDCLTHPTFHREESFADNAMKKLLL
jgi:hypothetical protein